MGSKRGIRIGNQAVEDDGPLDSRFGSLRNPTICEKTKEP